MRLAVIYNKKDVYIEFPPEKFKELLKQYLKKFNGDVDKAMNEIGLEIKRAIIRK